MSGEAAELTPFIREEPFGHVGDQSKIERFLTSLPPGPRLSFNRERAQRFDVASGMSYAPTVYVGRPFELEDENPPDDWVLEGFETFVRTEFSARPGQSQGVPPAPVVVEHRILPSSFIDEFLEASEDVERIAWPGTGDHQSMARSVYSLLCDPRVGSRRNAINNSEPEVTRHLQPVIAREERLLFVLPGFPFKDQNLFRVPFGADCPDLADISFLIRLHKLTQALYQVHPFGADVLVLTDGSLYADLFGVAQTDVSHYQRRLRSYRNDLNLQGTVSLFPIKDLLDGSPGDGGKFKRTQGHIAALLERIDTGKGPSGSMAALAQGMRRNMQTRTRLAGLDYEEAWDVVWGGPSSVINERNAALRRELDETVGRAAIEYASVNLALRWTRLLDLSFPGSIRGTVHAKPGQFALAGAGGAYAWNGVAWCKAGVPRSIDDVEVKPFSALGDGRPVIAYEFQNGQPAFYAPSADSH